jgi:adenylosuccinate lyase
MIPRYSRPDMARLWSDESRFGKWLAVEIAATEVLADRGVVPPEALAAIKERSRFEVKRIEEIEREVQHDVIAFVSAVVENVGPEGRWLHYGLTSSDVVDTALAILMRDACDLVRTGLVGLMEAVREKAFRHRHALSGAVGTFSHLPPEVEEEVCRRLGLVPVAVSSQVLQRDRHAEVMATLALLAASLEKFATEIRALQKTEVRELEEPFGKGQKGSSAMPHKRNPVGCEQVSGLARLVRANALAALENVSLWHERDISHSSVERVIIPDSFLALDHMLHRFTRIVRGMSVNEERMLRNLEIGKGLVFSGQLLLELTARGMRREDAYRVVQAHAMEAWQHSGDFQARVREDPEIGKTLTEAEINEIFRLERYLEHVDAIFARVFG